MEDGFGDLIEWFGTILMDQGNVAWYLNHLWWCVLGPVPGALTMKSL